MNNNKKTILPAFLINVVPFLNISFCYRIQSVPMVLHVLLCSP